MSITSSSRKAGPYNGNGVTVAFPFSFKVFSSADLLVVKTTPAEAESTLVLTTDYTASLNADQDSNPGGTVTAVSAPATGHKITIASQVAELQPVVLTNAGGFYPTVINAALDRLTILVQQLSEKVSRAMTVGISSGLNPNSVISSIFASAETAVTAAENATISAAAAAASASAITLPIPVASGGTGSANATDARTALGVPSGTGSGASGTWGISISGTAATATAIDDGAVSTAEKVVNGVITAQKLSGGTGTGNITQYTAATTPLPSVGGVFTGTHAIGVVPAEAVLELTCLSADAGYAVEDVVDVTIMGNGSNFYPFSTYKNTTGVGFKLASGYSATLTNKSSGSLVVPTAASWSYRFRLRAA